MSRVDEDLGCLLVTVPCSTNYHMASTDRGYTSRSEHAYTSKMAALVKIVM